MAAKITCEGALLLCIQKLPIRSKRNYANYSQNVCTFTEVCGLSLRPNYLIILISTVSVYFWKENYLRHPGLLIPVTNCMAMTRGKRWRGAA